MSRRARLKPTARLDLEEAHAWYEEQSPGLGDRFAKDVDSTVGRLAEHPEAHAVVDGRIRRALLRRFPYGVFYIVEDHEVVIIAILHAARGPTTWLGRA